jgi:hypothetical protein
MSALPDQLPRARSTPAFSTLRFADECTGGQPVNPLLRVSGGLGFAGVLLGLALLVFACAGFTAAFYFSPAVILFGIIGGLLTLISARRSPLTDDSRVLAGLFLAALCLLGGVLELAVWQKW